MATTVQLLNEMDNIVEEKYRRMQDAELSRDREYWAIVRIQSWYRGIRARAYIRYLVQCVNCIQRRWRGYRARHLVREKLKNKLHMMKFDYYNKMATKIQKTWRGYRSRKYVFNFSQRKRFFTELCKNNESIRKELAEYASLKERDEKLKQDIENEKQKNDFASRHHYLVSTVVLPGIYNSPFQLAPDELENRMRNVKVSKDYRSSHSQSATETSRRNTLPPVVAKPLGPFRDPHEVQQQRYRPLQPTVRVMTDYFSLDEARQMAKLDERSRRLVSADFRSGARLSPKHHEPLVNTSTQYGQIPYGTKYFREEVRDVWLSKNFRTTVPPIPVFDQFNKTY